AGYSGEHRNKLGIFMEVELERLVGAEVALPVNLDRAHPGEDRGLDTHPNETVDESLQEDDGERSERDGAQRDQRTPAVPAEGAQGEEKEPHVRPPPAPRPDAAGWRARRATELQVRRRPRQARARTPRTRSRCPGTDEKAHSWGASPRGS